MLGYFLRTAVITNHTVNKKVWITTNRAGKVSVIVSSKAIVTMILLWIASLLHRTKKHHGQYICIRFSLNSTHDVLKCLLANLTGSSINAQAKTWSIINKLLNLFSLWLLVNSINERQIKLTKMLGNCFIGHQHKGLNHALGNTTLTKHDINRLTLFIH